VILSSDGLILTNYHVVEGGASFDVTLPGQGADQRPIPARPFQCAAEDDLATLQMTPLTFLKSVTIAAKRPAVGQRVFAIGSPLDLEGTLTAGIVSQIREDKGKVLIQTTVPISHGSSGGGLFLSDGSLVGITTQSIRTGHGLHFAISVANLAALSACGSFPPLPPMAEEDVHAAATPFAALPLTGNPCLEMTRLRDLVARFVKEDLAATERMRTEDNVSFETPAGALEIIVFERKNGSFGDIPEEAVGAFWVALDDLKARYHGLALTAKDFMKTKTIQSDNDVHRAIEALGRPMRVFFMSFEALQESMKPLCPRYEGVELHRPGNG
jgi:hypothetical protein